MWQRSSRGQYVEILLFTLLSLLLYWLGFFLFLVPLQVVASRRGIRGLALAAGAFFMVFLAVHFWPAVFSPGHALPDALGSIEIGIAGVCLLGMIVVNLPLARKPRTLALLLCASGIAGAILAPLILAVYRMPTFLESVDQMSADALRRLTDVLPPDTAAAAFISEMARPAQLRVMTEALMRSFLAAFLVLFTVSWWAGQAAARRRTAFVAGTEGFRLSSFRLESWWLWPLILSGTLVLADLFFGISGLGLPWLAYAAWNVGVVLLFLFGLQGMAIVMFVFEKYRLPRLLWFLLVAGILVLAAPGRAGVFIVLAIPVLGISENWIRLRIPRRAAPSE